MKKCSAPAARAGSDEEAGGPPALRQEGAGRRDKRDGRDERDEGGKVLCRGGHGWSENYQAVKK